jgi:hypothetical protein
VEWIRIAPPALVSEAVKAAGRGAMILRSFFLVAMAALVASPAAAEIGRIKSTVGTATVQRQATQIPAAIGQDLMLGDSLETGKDGRITLTFIDNTRFAIGPDSRIALTKFDYDRTSQKGEFVAQVERGSIAVVSGKISKSGRDAMQLLTPDGVLDVRGTRFIVEVRR